MLVFFPAGSARAQSIRDLLGSVGAPRAAANTPPHPSVARIVVPERGGTSYGSGSLVDVHGEYALVITNWHVVSDRVGDVSVQFPDGFQSAGKVLKVDKDWDLAAIGIWRPPAQALRFASGAPQIGEPLAIAGYGPGQWRLASGRCTQFVSPGTQFPADMVEVSVEARQGDSGGPIFNQQGEIAGVLFGAGRGATSGSHAPRVQNFLESVYPILREAPQSGLASNGAPVRNESAKPPVIAAAAWEKDNFTAETRREPDALLIEEEPAQRPNRPAAPLVAAQPTYRRATDRELKDWVTPHSQPEPPEVTSTLAQPESRPVARINRKQLSNEVALRDLSTKPASSMLVEPSDKADCAKFDPAFPSLSGGVEGETFSLESTPDSPQISGDASKETGTGEGLFAQGKSFLAILGGITILFQLGKFLSGGKAA